MGPSAVVKPGIVCLLARAGRRPRNRVALLASAASVLPDGTHTLDALVEAGVNIGCVLGPEHGLRSAMAAGGSEPDYIDPQTGIPVIDAYLADPRRLRSVLDEAGVEEILVDLPDVGTRCFTYVSTMCDVLAAAASSGRRVIVLDRPNPLGGLRVEGPLLEDAFTSFVGRLRVPLRHGLTLGELALVWATGARSPEPEVVRAEGWTRPAGAFETGLPWVPPSPNLGSPAAAYCYPGTVLIEGTTLSEGRGSASPFEFVGAPFCDGRFARAVRAVGIPGAAISERHLVPGSGPYSSQRLVGIGIHPTDRASFRPVRASLVIMALALELYPEMHFEPEFFDALAGGSELRERLASGQEPDEIERSWEPQLEKWRADHGDLLIYGQ